MDTVKKDSRSHGFSGEGTISGPGMKGRYKTSMALGVVLLVVLLTAGVFFVQSKTSSNSPSPTSISNTQQPISMETFDKEQAENPVTPENAEVVAAKNQAEVQYGVDRNSINNLIIGIFADSIQ